MPQYLAKNLDRATAIYLTRTWDGCDSMYIGGVLKHIDRRIEQIRNSSVSVSTIEPPKSLGYT